MSGKLETRHGRLRKINHRNEKKCKYRRFVNAVEHSRKFHLKFRWKQKSGNTFISCTCMSLASRYEGRDWMMLCRYMHMYVCVGICRYKCKNIYNFATERCKKRLLEWVWQDMFTVRLICFNSNEMSYSPVKTKSWCMQVLPDCINFIIILWLIGKNKKYLIGMGIYKHTYICILVNGFLLSVKTSLASIYDQGFVVNKQTEIWSRLPKAEKC